MGAREKSKQLNGEQEGMKCSGRNDNAKRWRCVVHNGARIGT